MEGNNKANVKQVIFSILNKNSNITQVGGGYIQPPSKLILDIPIYFIFGDSDIQLYIYKVDKNITEDYYYSAMEKALKLLIVFKPFTANIIISASSIIQSRLTYRLIDTFKCFICSSEPHFFILRRESNWKDYFTKRCENCKDLYKHERYKLYYDKNMHHYFNDIPALKKSIYTGLNCSNIWIEKVRNVMGNDHSKNLFSYELLEEKVNDILDKSIFVWEKITENLSLERFPVRIYNELNTALVDSYLYIYSQTYLIPYNMCFLKDNYWIKPSDTYYTNIRFLHEIVRMCEVEKEFYNFSPEKILKLISNPEFIEFKSNIEKVFTNDMRLSYALKHKRHFINALRVIA